MLNVFVPTLVFLFALLFLVTALSFLGLRLSDLGFLHLTLALFLLLLFLFPFLLIAELFLTVLLLLLDLAFLLLDLAFLLLDLAFLLLFLRCTLLFVGVKLLLHLLALHLCSILLAPLVCTLRPCVLLLALGLCELGAVGASGELLGLDFTSFAQHAPQLGDLLGVGTILVLPAPVGLLRDHGLRLGDLWRNGLCLRHRLPRRAVVAVVLVVFHGVAPCGSNLILVFSPPGERVYVCSTGRGW